MLDTKEHYKLYKDGKHWVAAKIVTAAGVAFLSTAIISMGGGKANADNVNTANSSPTVALSTASPSSTVSPQNNGSNGVSQSKASVSSTNPQTNQGQTSPNSNVTTTSSQQNQNAKQTKSADISGSNGGNSTASQSSGTSNGINVDVPHKGLTDAVNKAQQTGVEVTQGQTQHQETTADKSNEVQDQIKKDYANQASQIQDATKKQEAVNDAKNTANDHSKLDQAVDDAKKNGVDVVKDNDKTVSGSPEDANKVKDEISKDYQSQTDAINKDKEQYKEALDKYNQEMKKYDNQGLAMDGVDSSTIKQELKLDKSPDATMTYEPLTSDATFSFGAPTYSSTGCDSKQALVVVAKDKSGISGDIAKVTCSNINATYGGKKINKIVATYSDLKPGDGLTNPDTFDNSKGNPFLRIYSDPTDGFWYNNSDGVTVTYQYYDENGNLINLNDNDAYMTVGSLNNSNGTATAKEHLEKATLDSDGKAIALKDSSVSAHDKTLYSDKNNDNNQKEWDVTGSDKAYYGSGVFALNGNSVKMTFSTDNQDCKNATVWVQMSTTIPQTPVKPKAPTIHYHYDKADIPNVKASYHLTDLSVTPQNHKDVESGTITGDTDASINGGTVVAGDKLTFPVTNSNLPANRTDDMHSYEVVDKLDNDVKYTGYKATLGGKDVSDQFTPELSQNSDGTWTIKLSANKTLLDQMNADKSKEFVVPTIDIYGEALNDNSEIDNSVKTFINGHEVQSNTVDVHTPTMNPTKDVVQDVGNQSSINNKDLTIGQYFDYKLNSSERPKDYRGTTTEWGGTDYLDKDHVEFTGQWQVFTDHDFQLADGTVVKKGTDISKYFTMTYDANTGKFSVEANKDFLNIMNLDANKKTVQSWSVFIQCKAIKDGEAENTWIETYNGKARKSNTVKNKIVSPKKTETPKKEEAKPNTLKSENIEKASPQKASPQKEVSVSPQPIMAAATPLTEPEKAPEKQAMPQTGEDSNDEAIIAGLLSLTAVVGTVGLGLRRKRYGE